MRILVVQLKRLGDLVLTTPALAALRQQKPGCRITLAGPVPARIYSPSLLFTTQGINPPPTPDFPASPMHDISPVMVRKALEGACSGATAPKG